MNALRRFAFPLLGALVLLSGRAVAADPAASIAEGDSHWEKRAEGAAGEIAKTVEIDAAVKAYRAALTAQPGSVAARARLLRALYYRGVYCGASAEERKSFFGDAKKVGDAGVDRLEMVLGGAKGSARIDALRKEPEAVAIYYWTAACWGEWALAYGKFAAAKEGAAARIRDLAQTVIDLDPAFEEAGGARILGRLHHQSPKIPFITGWVSRDDALANLRKAVATGPKSKSNAFFLAEAILDYEPAKKAEAKQLLEKAASEPNRPELAVEEAHYAALARKKLAELK